MNLKSTLLLSLFCCLSVLTYSQDIHYTNYYYSPLQLSPAKTGGFAGTYRFGANLREQFNSFIVEPYTTLVAQADMNIAYGLKPYHWIGAGINVFTDKSGDLDFKSSGAHLSLAYHYALDPKYKTIVTLGLQFGMTQRRIDNSNYRSLETLSGNTDSDQNLLENFNPTISDFNVGLSLKKRTSKKAYFDLGVSMYHLLQKHYNFTGSNIRNVVGNRINGYAEYHYQSSKQLAIKPIIVYSRMFNFQNLFGQFNLEYRPNKKSQTTIKGGLGYRSGDAVQFLAGMIYKGWDVGIAYDLTVSSAADLTNRFGGIEIGIRKILIVNTEPKVDPVILCPKF